jgi:hypothetical protein
MSMTRVSVSLHFGKSHFLWKWKMRKSRNKNVINRLNEKWADKLYWFLLSKKIFFEKLLKGFQRILQASEELFKKIFGLAYWLFFSMYKLSKLFAYIRLLYDRIRTHDLAVVSPLPSPRENSNSTLAWSKDLFLSFSICYIFLCFYFQLNSF